MSRPSLPRRGLALSSALISSLLLTPGCAGIRLSPPILAALDCSQAIPPSYRKPVPGTPLLRPDATVGELAGALDGQTTQLDQANGRAADLVAIADACQARQAAVVAALTPKPWWQPLADLLPKKRASAP